MRFAGRCGDFGTGMACRSTSAAEAAGSCGCMLLRAEAAGTCGSASAAKAAGPGPDRICDKKLAKADCCSKAFFCCVCVLFVFFLRGVADLLEGSLDVVHGVAKARAAGTRHYSHKKTDGRDAGPRAWITHVHALQRLRSLTQRLKSLTSLCINMYAYIYTAVDIAEPVRTFYLKSSDSHR